MKEKQIKTKKLTGKLIKLFSVITMTDYENMQNKKQVIPNKFITITQSPEECIEYIDALEHDDRYDHYVNWCKQRNISEKDVNSWELYKQLVIHNDFNYAVYEMTVYWEDILAFVRMFQGCVPLNCSFDRDVEKIYFIKKLKSELFKEKENKEKEDFFKEKEINKEDIVN